MTSESGAGADEPDKQNSFDANPDGAIKGRKVAKTMLNGQIPQIPESSVPPEATDEPDLTQSSKRVAKTKLEMTRPTAEQIIAASDTAAVEQEQSKRKVNKTMLEVSRPDLTAVQEAAIAAANAAPDSKRTVPKTQIEVSRPDLSGIDVPTKSSKTNEELPKKTPKTMMEMSLPAFSDTAKQVKKVSKTMLDVNSLDAIGMAKAIKKERANVPVKVRKTLTRDQDLPNLLDVNNALTAAAANEHPVISGSDVDSDTVVSTPSRDVNQPPKNEKSLRKASRRTAGGTERFVAKTMLDHSILSEQVMRSHEKEKVKAAYIAQERANEPVNAFHAVESDKMASPCAWSWEGPSGNRGRVRACERCQTQVYDFTGMDMADAEALIFKQESKKKFALYKRADGKFMTTDCPVQMQRKRNLILLCVVGALVMIIAVALMILMPPPPPPPAVSAPKPEATPAAVQTGTNGSASQPSSGFFTSVGEETTAKPAATTTPATQTPQGIQPSSTAPTPTEAPTTTRTGDQDDKYWNTQNDK
ncbi:MAG: hypothetical protein JST89_23360 [Cyanobacteria bacterium SZAS-4]|nr:hypothetical protein [Cyanobacteria bacterium SZAS-4]